ncbi:hypothetical protein HYH03_013487 [Edaphochlamys debaryana]|uniref:J domain-containing protein n=1 Tax=Edaphochlamys debaryana TaxID=47281 RepID=A0A835XN27_9CHLO|nr:hypothetical protein HYH03_013487 [Edaphochlamys debaryana]|eukprot:KAG2487907.1 hypothetical protein HYH03_013487 [Edaphochlamys debaryana]
MASTRRRRPQQPRGEAVRGLEVQLADERSHRRRQDSQRQGLEAQLELERAGRQQAAAAAEARRRQEEDAAERQQAAEARCRRLETAVEEQRLRVALLRTNLEAERAASQQQAATAAKQWRELEEELAWYKDQAAAADQQRASLQARLLEAEASRQREVAAVKAQWQAAAAAARSQLEQERGGRQRAEAEAGQLRRTVEELTAELQAHRARQEQQRQRKQHARDSAPPPPPPPGGHGAGDSSWAGAGAGGFNGAGCGAGPGSDGAAPPPPPPPPPPAPEAAADEVFAAAKAPCLDGTLSVRELRQFLAQAGSSAAARLCTEKRDLLALARQRLGAWHVRRAGACSRLAGGVGDWLLFGLSPGAPVPGEAALQACYKDLALRLHPDKNPGDGEATAAFQYLQDAYERMRAAAGAARGA